MEPFSIRRWDMLMDSLVSTIRSERQILQTSLAELREGESIKFCRSTNRGCSVRSPSTRPRPQPGAVKKLLAWFRLCPLDLIAFSFALRNPAVSSLILRLEDHIVPGSSRQQSRFPPLLPTGLHVKLLAQGHVNIDWRAGIIGAGFKYCRVLLLFLGNNHIELKDSDVLSTSGRRDWKKN